MFRRDSNLRPHDFPDEEVVFVDETIVGEPAFEIGIALANQRRLHLFCLVGCQSEMVELIDLGAGAVPDTDHLVGQCCCRQVDDAFAAAADHLETMVMVAGRDNAADQGWRELHDGMPAHGHDVAAAVPGRGNQDDGARLKVPANFVHRHVVLLEMLYSH